MGNAAYSPSQDYRDIDAALAAVTTAIQKAEAAGTPFARFTISLNGETVTGIGTGHLVLIKRALELAKAVAGIAGCY